MTIYSFSRPAMLWNWSLPLLFAALVAFAVAPVMAGAPSPKVEQVIVVFKTHFDIGYTDLARNVVNRYRTSMIDKALDVCEDAKNMPPEQRFVWTVPGWPMAQILWPGQTAERRERTMQAIHDGRLVWHALPGSLHTESLDLEDLVRGMRSSSDLSRQTGTPLPLDAKMTDVASHTWILATILKRAGVEFLHIGSNSESASPELPRLYWWQGPDGSRLLTMYTAGGYGTGLKAPDGWPSKTWLALIHTNDNEGPPTANDVRKLVEQAKRELPGVKLRFGRLSDFADAVIKENPSLPVVRADMPDTWIHGIGSMPVETALARRIRPQIGTLECFNTLLGGWGVKRPDVKAAVAKAYEGSMLFGEHTWGCSGEIIGWKYGEAWEKDRLARKAAYDFAEESWTEKGDRIRVAEKAVAPALDSDMGALARAVRVSGPRIVVFNPLPWARDDIVTTSAAILHAPDSGWNGTPVLLEDVATGRKTTAAVTVFGKGSQFIARDVPPLGYRTYVPMGEIVEQGTHALPNDPDVLENEYLRVRLDPKRGVVASLIDKQSGRELIDTTSKYGFGQYLYERFDADQGHNYLVAFCKSHPWPGWAEKIVKPNLPSAKEVPCTAASPKRFSRFSLERGPITSMALMTGHAQKDLPHDVLVAVRLRRGCPFVDVVLAISLKKADPWPEAGWLCFPFKVDKPTFQLGRLGSIIDPAKDCRRGSNNEVFCLNSGMTVLDPAGAGVGLCSPTSPLVSLGHPGLFRYTKDFTPREPTVFVNLYNNQWGTNFQQWIGNVPSFTVRIWAAHKGSSESELITPSWEARQPCLAASFDGPAGDLAPSQSGVELSRKGVLLTAFGANPDGDGTLLRIWEQAGKAGPCCVRLPQSFRNATALPCDLRGQTEGKPLPVHDGQLTLSLAPFAPASVILQNETLPK
jgi:hypothetical protein